jgi:hypothetical protein
LMDVYLCGMCFAFICTTQQACYEHIVGALIYI